MRLLRRTLQWIGRRALLYAALVLAFAAAPLISEAWTQASDDRAVFQGLDAVEKQLRSGYPEWERAFNASSTTLETRSTK